MSRELLKEEARPKGRARLYGPNIASTAYVSDTVTISSTASDNNPPKGEG